MNKIYLLVPCLLFLFTGNAQKTFKNIQNLVVKGYVINQKTLQPLEFATISLANNDNPDQIQGVITDSSGFFNIQLSPGTYNFKAEFIGFIPFTIENLVITETKDFGKIGLKISQNLLNEV